ncbi:MAG: hypothetical protein HYZ63_02265 [Candidatus Andersenbacteria bacterium]|nr:hypothetical protein [Candidatus Andersenbacteria bacterium]
MYEHLLEGILPEPKSDNKKISSGVHMTVWQQLPARPEIQALIHQQQEIEAIKHRLLKQEERLTQIETKVHKMEISYNSILKTLHLIDSIE